MYTLEDICMLGVVLCFTPILLPILFIASTFIGYFIIVMHIGMSVHYEKELREQGKDGFGWFSTWLNVLYFMLSLPITIPYSIGCIIFRNSQISNKITYIKETK